MSFMTPKRIPSSNPKTCTKCGKHVNNARAVSWENNVCPWCYAFKKEEPPIDDSEYNFNPLDTVAHRIIVSPMTVYLNLYTYSEMRMMKK